MNDYTHSNDYGGYLLAGFVAEETKRVCSGMKEYQLLADCMTKGFGCWNPPEKIAYMTKPDWFEGPLEAPDACLKDIDQLEKVADRVFVLDMVTKTARFVPVNVYNDWYEDVEGHEWYAGVVESAYQNGIIPAEMVDGTYLHPQKPVTLEEFVVFAMSAYRCRKKLAKERVCIYDKDCQDFTRSFVRQACEIGLLKPDGSEGLKESITRGRVFSLCRKLKI